MSESEEPRPIDYDALASGAFESVDAEGIADAIWLRESQQTRPTDPAFLNAPDASVFPVTELHSGEGSDQKYIDDPKTGSRGIEDYAERKAKRFRIAVKVTPE